MSVLFAWVCTIDQLNWKHVIIYSANHVSTKLRIYTSIKLVHFAEKRLSMNTKSSWLRGINKYRSSILTKLNQECNTWRKRLGFIGYRSETKQKSYKRKKIINTGGHCSWGRQQGRPHSRSTYKKCKLNCIPLFTHLPLLFRQLKLSKLRD